MQSLPSSVRRAICTALLCLSGWESGEACVASGPLQTVRWDRPIDVRLAPRPLNATSQRPAVLYLPIASARDEWIVPTMSSDGKLRTVLGEHKPPQKGEAGYRQVGILAVASGTAHIDIQYRPARGRSFKVIFQVEGEFIPPPALPTTVLLRPSDAGSSIRIGHLDKLRLELPVPPGRRGDWQLTTGNRRSQVVQLAGSAELQVFEVNFNSLHGTEQVDAVFQEAEPQSQPWALRFEVYAFLPPLC